MSETKFSIVLTHGHPHPGCERAALALQGRFFAHVRELRAAGRVDDARAYIFVTGSKSGRLGLLVVEGAREALDAVFWSKEWKTLVAQTEALTRDVHVDFAVGGAPESLAGPAGVYAAAVEELAAG
jgi:hypothetical protein